MVARCPLLLQDCENIHKTTSLLCQDKSGPGSFDNEFSSTCFPVTSTLSVKTHEDGEEQKNIGVPPWSSTYLHLKGDGKWERTNYAGHHLRQTAYVTQVTKLSPSVAASSQL